MPFAAAENARCRRDFPALVRQVAGRPAAFLDGPAGTQVPQAVIDAVSGHYRRGVANSHGAFVTAGETDALLQAVRGKVAAFLGASSPAAVSFGANMTTLGFSLAHALGRELRPGDRIVVTELDHEANRGPWLGLRQRGVEVVEVRLGADGTLDREDFAAKVTAATRIVAVGLASNALGTVNDVALARRLASGAGAWLVIDAVHYAPHFPIDVAALDPDFLLCSAYKFYGPHVGLLYSRPGLLERLEPDRLRTQEQAAPYRVETGTLNHAAIAGVGAAIDYVASWGRGEDLRCRIVSAMRDIAAWEERLARRYAERVAAVPGVRVWGPPFGDGERAPTVSITVDGIGATDAARELGRAGIFVWDGHFYAARALEVLGIAERGLLRAGVLMYSTEEEVDRLAKGVERLACR